MLLLGNYRHTWLVFNLCNSEYSMLTLKDHGTEIHGSKAIATVMIGAIFATTVSLNNILLIFCALK